MEGQEEEKPHRDRGLRRRESDPLFSMDDDDEENDGGAGQARRRKKDDKVPFTPEVSINYDDSIKKNLESLAASSILL
jgi:hypothetical protein